MFHRLLIPLDGSSLAEQAIGQAAAIARASHATLDVVRVVETRFRVEGPTPASAWADAHTYVATIAEEIESGAALETTHAALTGGAAEMIAQRAIDTGADLVVMTSRGLTGLRRAILGSVADGVIRHSHVPVLVVHPSDTAANKFHTRHSFKHLLVPLDGSPSAEEAVRAAGELAKLSGAELHLLQIVEPVPMLAVDAAAAALGGPPIYPAGLLDDHATQQLCTEAEEHLERLARNLNDHGYVAVTTHVVVATSIAPAIIDFARGHHIDLIAMSTHGRGASRLIVGSVADRVLRDSGLPMLIGRPQSYSDGFAAVASEAVVPSHGVVEETRA